MPIRPIVNFTTAPGFRTAKKLVKIIKDNLTIENNHTVKNVTDFIRKVNNIKLFPNYKLVSLDIVNLYTNIPINDTLNILRDNLMKCNKLNTQAIDELLNLLEVILKQNYFEFNDRFYSQRDGLAMGSPLSGLLADIYLNHYENTHLFSNNNHKNNICLLYTSRCV